MTLIPENVCCCCIILTTEAGGHLPGRRIVGESSAVGCLDLGLLTMSELKLSKARRPKQCEVPT